MSLNPQLKQGDRVVCYYMEGEISNVPIGTTGVVTKIVKVPFGMGIQYSVNWDNGSTLDLIPETDAWGFEEDNVLQESIEKFVNVLIDDGLNPEDFKEEISKLNDSDVSDEFLRNIDRKLLKSGDKTENVKKYINKYLKSLEDRKNIELVGNDDDFDEEEFMYGSEQPIKSKIGKKQYIKELMPMQVELLKLQEMVKDSGKPFVVVFEGRDSAGKGTMIRTLTQYLDPKYFKVVALGIPTPEERKDWFNRYKSQMEPNKMIFFDRSWYNRGIVEPVMGYSSEDEYKDFMENVYPFERSLVSAGIPLFKFWFSITPETQEKRFNLRKSSPLKYWKFSPNDAKSLEKWDEYTEYKKKAILATKTASPWYIIDNNDKRAGILNALRVILNNTDYPGKNDTHIGMTYPEIVTTVKEDALHEMTLTKKSKLIQESRELETMFRRDDAYSNIKPEDWDIIKQYLEFLRQSGIVNMFQAAPFLYAPLEWITDQAKWKDLDEYSEAALDSLIELNPQVQGIMVNAAIKSLGDKDFDVSEVNSKLRKISIHVLEDLFQNWS
jgi:polyphosphate kinase 2